MHFHLISSSVPFLSESWEGGHQQARPSAVPRCIHTPSSLEMTAPRVCVVPPRAPPPPLGGEVVLPPRGSHCRTLPPTTPSTWISLRRDAHHGRPLPNSRLCSHQRGLLLQPKLLRSEMYTALENQKAVSAYMFFINKLISLFGS